MHPCLRLSEIQLVICNLLANNRSSLLSLACTCSVLKEPALDTLWRKISSCRALFQCLPRDVWKFDFMYGQLCFSRALNDVDIAIFDKYRFRVQVLSLEAGLADIDLAILQRLSSIYLMDPLLPNLLRLKWGVIHGIDLLFIRLFLSRNLASFTITLPSLNPTVIRFMHKLPTFTSPHTFHRLRIGFRRQHDLSQLRSHSTSICKQWRFLRYIGLSGVTSEGFLHIAQMPYLEELSLGAQTQLEGIDHDFLRTEDPFPRLRSFTASSSPPHIRKMLPYIPLSLLVEFSMVSNDLEEVPGQQWSACMQILEQRLNPKTLKKFHIQYVHIAAPVNWTNDILSRILPFSALENVKLNFGGDVDLPVQYASEIAKAWPKITILDIGPHMSLPFHGSGLTPLSTLVPLANGCHTLQSLRLVINAADLDVQADLLASLTNSTLGSPNLSLECLRVDWSPIVHKEFVASLLLELFPNLARITTFRGSTGGSEEDLTHRKRWRKVGRVLIPILRMAKERASRKSYGPKVKEAANGTDMRLRSRWLLVSGSLKEDVSYEDDSTESETSEDEYSRGYTRNSVLWAL